MSSDKFYQGWRSETLAEYILSNFAFTVPVPVKSDVGVDFFCTLFKVSNNKDSILPDSSFAIQIKSAKTKTYLSKNCIDYLAGLEIPYFLGVVDKERNSMDVYSCQQMLCLLLKYGSLKSVASKFKILLNPVVDYSKKNIDTNLSVIIGNEYSDFQNLLSSNKIGKCLKKYKNGSYNVTLDVGPKIFSQSIECLNKSNREATIIKIKKWIDVDLRNKSYNRVYMPFLIAKYINEGTNEEMDYAFSFYHCLNYENGLYPNLGANLLMLYRHINEPKNIFGKLSKDAVDKFSRLVVDKIKPENPWNNSLRKQLMQCINQS